jgi:hypothetical protein
MPALTKEELHAALERAEQFSLPDDAVALQTAGTLPEDVDGVEPSTLDTAGSDQHGPVYSYTRGQVAEALRQLGEDFGASVREGEPARAREARAEAKAEAQRPSEDKAEEQTAEQPPAQPSGPQAARRGRGGEPKT